MLIRFRVANHRSLRDEQELSLEAAPISDSVDPLIPFGSREGGVLRSAVIYGANASGKSNVVHALSFMTGAVQHSQSSWDPEGGIPREPFCLDAVMRDEPSFFAVDLILDGVRYEYGFVVNSERVLEEWVYAYPKGHKQQWFIRDANEEREFKFGRSFGGENQAIAALTRPNSLFLSAAAQNNHELLRPLYHWFARQLRIADSEEKDRLWMQTVQLLKRDEYRDAIVDLLRSSDVGISGIDLADEVLPELSVRLLQTMFADDPEKLKALAQDPKIPRIHLLHTSGDGAIPIPFTSESRGTRALFGLAGTVVRGLKNGGVLFVDELEASLHPVLALALVELFNKPSTNPKNAQLVFTTHDTNLLDTRLLRRDQIWFTEKDKMGATRLYPLTEFRARKQENLERGYLQGRYGAVPFISPPRLEAILREEIHAAR